MTLAPTPTPETSGDRLLVRLDAVYAALDRLSAERRNANPRVPGWRPDPADERAYRARREALHRQRRLLELLLDEETRP